MPLANKHFINLIVMHIHKCRNNFYVKLESVSYYICCGKKHTFIYIPANKETFQLDILYLSLKEQEMNELK